MYPDTLSPTTLPKHRFWLIWLCCSPVQRTHLYWSKRLSPLLKAFCNLTWATLSASATTAPPEEMGFLRIHEASPGFCFWSDYILFLKCPHLQPHPASTISEEQVEFTSSNVAYCSVFTTLNEEFMSFVGAKNFPQCPFPILFPHSGTLIKLVRSSP